MKRLFSGGIHPKYHKEMSLSDTALVTLTPDHVVIPLLQHIGTPCQPLVAVGETVLVGQKIGDGDGLCVPVHASVSGRVTAIEPRPHPNGGEVLAVVIENDGLGRAVSVSSSDTSLSLREPDDILAAIREAGIVGMGGAAFPSDVKALSAMGKMETLIANACECEPYITADDLLLRRSPEEVLTGMRILKRLLQSEKAVIAVEDNKPEAIASLQAILSDYPEIELMILPTRYPQGAEKQLVLAVTEKEIPSGQLPMAVGCAVFNVSTLAAITHAVEKGLPLTRRIVTVTGEAVARPQNMVVPIGTPFSHLIEAAGGLTEDAVRVLNGGPMMGKAQETLSAPVVKATNAVLCLKINEKKKRWAEESTACLRCGRCVAACPMHLKPLYIHRFVDSGNPAELTRLHVMDCMECGCCAFSCPAKLPLVESCRAGKKLVKEGGSV